MVKKRKEHKNGQNKFIAHFNGCSNDVGHDRQIP